MGGDYKHDLRMFFNLQCRWRTVFTQLRTVTMRRLEVNALLAEIDKIAVNTRFNDVAVLDGSYDKTIRAGNTNAETIRVSVGSLTAASTATIEQHAVEKAFLMTGGTNAGTDANPTDLDVLEGNSVTIDTSVFSSTFTSRSKLTAWEPFLLQLQ